jgi:hypothetical protein
MKIITSWKRFMAVGCSHGMYADPRAIDAVVQFRQRWKPNEVIHLGDFTDMSPFMSSAKGQGDSIEPDISGGLSFLHELRPTVVLGGNHEARLWREAQSSDEVYAGYAMRLIRDIEEHCEKRKARFLPYTGVWQTYKLADFTFTHGTIYNENSARDMAETYGNVIFAHTHKVTRATGRRIDSPTGISVGTLTRRACMDYANTRRSTLGWAQGFAFGYYSEKKLISWVHEQPHDCETWMLPV